MLVNFGHIDRMDLLERILNGHGRWCASVASAGSRSSTVDGLEALRHAPPSSGQRGSPRPTLGLDILLLRDQLAGPGDPPHAHLGEAETIALMTRRSVATCRDSW